jgi:aminoglycoside phosphotransferase (APT) family kinase protein
VADVRPKTSSRDHDVVRAQLTRWLSARLDRPTITDFRVPATNGMSSETILFDVSYQENGRAESQQCVLRLPPDPTAYPVFMAYDMARQFEAMRLVGERSTVPVPPTRWLETDSAALGAPFFVMGRVDGIVPPDLMPYPFGGNWFYDSTPQQQTALQRATIETIAAIHSIELSAADRSRFVLDQPGNTPLRRHMAEQQAYYDWTVADGVRSPLIERAIAWLNDHWPTEGPSVISWGDSRVGNILYRDYQPVAVLDWEMVAEGPAEIDLGWCIFIHRFFQDMATKYGVPGMPDFMTPADVVAQYESLTGQPVNDLRWFLLYAAMRHGIVMFRITRRSIHFGEAVMPDDPDTAIAHHETISAMLDGSYWARIGL